MKAMRVPKRAKLTPRLFVRAFAASESVFPLYAAVVVDMAFTMKHFRLMRIAREESLRYAVDACTVEWDHDPKSDSRESELCVSPSGTFFFRTVFSPDEHQAIETAPISFKEVNEAIFADLDNDVLFFGPLYPMRGDLNLDALHLSQIDEAYDLNERMDEQAGPVEAF